MKHFTTHSIAILVALVLAGSMAITAQTLSGGYDDSSEYFNSKKHNKWRTSANFKKALDILNDVDENEDIDYDEAIDLLEDEVMQHPTNGYAVCNNAIARVNKDAGELGMLAFELLYGGQYQMDEIEEIFKKRNAKSLEIKSEAAAMLEKGMAMIPAADKENLCKAYITYGNLQVDLEDTEKALAAYEQAATILPCYQSYDILMKYCLEHGDNDKALQYASKLGNKIDEDNEALRKLAQVYIDNNDYDKAKTLINKAVANDESDSDAYQMLIDMLIAEGKYKEALDKTIDCSKYFQGSELLRNLSTIYDANNDCRAMVLSKLWQLETETPEVSDDDEQEAIEWGYIEGLLYYYNDRYYRSALSCFDKLLERKPSAPLLSLKADCHYMLGDAPKALKIINYALRMPGDSEGSSIKEQLLKTKIRIEMWCGMNEEQIYDSQVYCKAFPNESTVGFEALTRGYFNKGQYAKALEVCDEWVEQFDNDIEARYFHAFILKLWGKDDKARVEMQDIINDENCSVERKMFALLYMGETEKSRALLDELAKNSELAADSKEPDVALDDSVETMTFYNLACAYSQHGEIDRALYFLERYYAEDSTATDFDYAFLDDELNNARKNPQFLEIINKYKQKWLKGELNLKK